jgi:hypothetical protein
MPSPYRGERPYPGQEWTLRHAAEAGQIVVCRCVLCRSSVRYLAADLVAFFDPGRDARQPYFSCASCGKDEWLRVTLTYPAKHDFGEMLIRRPGEVKMVQTWKWVRLGE